MDTDHLKFIIFYVYVILCVWVFFMYVCMVPDSSEGGGRALDPLGFELQVIVSYYLGVGK